MQLAIARALCLADERHRKKLREQGLLTRDPRVVERKKPGRAGARKRFQFWKRKGQTSDLRHQWRRPDVERLKQQPWPISGLGPPGLPPRMPAARDRTHEGKAR